jgi:hypothetical protein
MRGGPVVAWDGPWNCPQSEESLLTDAVASVSDEWRVKTAAQRRTKRDAPATQKKAKLNE